MENDFYVYIYLDPRKSGEYKYGEYEFGFEPFYVGKGKIKYNEKGNITYNRWKKLDGRNDYFINKFNKIKENGLEPIVVKIKENMIEDDSFLLEIELIDIIGRENLGKGPLVNFTDGGEGVSGYTHTEEELEKQRKDLIDIKQKFEERGYNLLTEEKDYKNCYTKLDYVCPEGHRKSIAWSNFQQGNGCPKCATELNSEKLKMNFTDIKKAFEERNYMLLTKEEDYKNSKQKLDYICPIGHQHSISWGSFRQGHDCPICSRYKIYFSEIQKEFERRKYTLLTLEEDYKNCDTKLNYICPEGHQHSISWDSFQRGSGCPICGNESASEKTRKDFSDIKLKFEERGYNLLTEGKDYKNAHQKLNYICPRGHKHLITWSHFQQGRRCPICGTESRSKKRRMNFSDIKKTFERRGYNLLTKEEDYKNSKQKLNYIHNKCGNNHSISWSHFQQGQGCPKCNKENRKRKDLQK